MIHRSVFSGLTNKKKSIPVKKIGYKNWMEIGEKAGELLLESTKKIQESVISWDPNIKTCGVA